MHGRGELCVQFLQQRWRDSTCLQVMEKHTCLNVEMNVSVAACRKVISLRTCSMLSKLVSVDWRWWTQTLSDPRDCERGFSPSYVHSSVSFISPLRVSSQRCLTWTYFCSRSSSCWGETGWKKWKLCSLTYFMFFGFILFLKIYQMPVSPIKVKRTSFHHFLTFIYSQNPTVLCILISSLPSFLLSHPYIFCSFNLFPFSPRFSISLSSSPLLSPSPSSLPLQSPPLKALPSSFLQSPLSPPFPATFSRLSLRLCWQIQQINQRPHPLNIKQVPVMVTHHIFN